MADSELRPTHLPTDEHFARWAQRSRDQPLRMLSSACLTGLAVGYDGSDYGGYPAARALIERPEVRTFGFCPEDFAFGTPRDLCDIHGGDGFDVLDGRARVYNDRGEDWTADMLEAAEEMARFAREHQVELCLMLDVSAACGSTIISDGPRAEGRRVPGAGGCAARLIRDGLPVLSQRDHATLARLHRLFEPDWQSPEPERDHFQHPWYVENFGPSARRTAER